MNKDAIKYQIFIFTENRNKWEIKSFQQFKVPFGEWVIVPVIYCKKQQELQELMQGLM